MAEKKFLIFRVRTSRLKAIDLALKEVSVLFADSGADFVIGGPLSQQKGIIAASFPSETETAGLIAVFQRLGYVCAADEMIPCRQEKRDAFKWKGNYYFLENIYSADEEELRNQAPDKRTFLLPDADGNPHRVTGYRGDGSKTGRRALPVEDCKFMINLSGLKEGQKLLDPFAGAGGIVFFAVKNALKVYSSDVDEKMQYGLRDFGSKHFVADIRKLPFENDFFDAIVTEAPFDEEVTATVADGLSEMKRVIKSKGAIVMMAASYQAEQIRQAAKASALMIDIDRPLNRKGTAVHIFKFLKE